MEIARILAAKGEPHGTVIAADFQEAGRGRIRDRKWDSEKGKNLLFTVLLRYSRAEDIPPALTLKAGLAMSLAIEDFAPALAGRVKIKWPNDVLILSDFLTQRRRDVEMKRKENVGRKICGIYTEAEGGNVFLGIGVNVAQEKFPDALLNKATSIKLCLDNGNEPDKFFLLEKILTRLHEALDPENNNEYWHERINDRLYKKNEKVSFAEGAAGSEKIVTGALEGISPNGELNILPDGENTVRSFITGELLIL